MKRLNIKNLKTFFPILLAGACIAILTACGGDAPTPVAIQADVEPTATTETPTETPTAVPEPTATTPPTPEPTATPVPPTPTAVPTPTPEPTAEPTPQPTVTTEPVAADSADDVAEAEEPADGDDAASNEQDDDEQAPADDTAVEPVDVGSRVYAVSCASCHGPTGQGTNTGPPLLGIGQFFPDDASPITNLVTNGGTNMPEFGSKLTAEEINAVVEYVVATFQ